MKYFPKVVKYVKDSYGESGSVRLKHFERTVYWVEQLMEDADEAMKIAAYAHDIERAFRGSQDEKGEEVMLSSDDQQDRHQVRGAEYVAKFLKKERADQTLIDRVHELISKHEVGGNQDQNTLKDADSVSFFENNAGIYIDLRLSELGKEGIRKKFEWMFERITSEKAKAIAKPMYEGALKKLAETD